MTEQETHEQLKTDLRLAETERLRQTIDPPPPPVELGDREALELELTEATIRFQNAIGAAIMGGVDIAACMGAAGMELPPFLASTLPALAGGPVAGGEVAAPPADS